MPTRCRRDRRRLRPDGTRASRSTPRTTWRSSSRASPWNNSNAALAPHGLVYPVFPGETSASLGGNVNTNAGGMRAIRYGVTRHQVLGLEAVLAGGEVIRTGGRFVKSLHRLRPDPADRRFRGHAGARHRGDAQARTPASLTRPPSSPPSARSTQVTAAVPRIMAQGVAPRILEYLDVTHDGEHHDERRTSISGSPQEVRDARPGLPGRRARGHPRRSARRGRRVALGQAPGRTGRASTSTSSRRGAGAALIEAREQAFFVAKAAGADDIVDAVVPRAAIAGVPRRVAALADEHGALVVGLRPRRRRQRPPVGLPARPGPRAALLEAIFEAAVGHGGAVSGEHGIGTEKQRYFLELEDPVKLELMRRIKDAFDPNGILAPGHVLGPPEHHGLNAMNGAECLLESLVASGVDVCFINPGTSEMHFVAALDARPRDARRAHAVRGRGHRRGRRLRPHARAPRPRPSCTSGRGSATAWPTSTTPGGPAPRWSTSSATTPPTTSSSTPPSSPRSRAWPARLPRLRPAGHRRRRRSALDAAEAVRAAIEAPGEVATLIVPGRRRRGPTAGWPAPPPAAAAAAPAPTRRVRRRWRASLRARRAGGPPARRRRAVGARGLARPPADRRRDRLPRSCARPSRPASPAARALPAVERLGLLRRDGDGAAARVAHLVLVDADARRSASSPTRDNRAGSCPTAAQLHVLCRTGRRRPGARSRRWPTPSGRRARRASPRDRSARPALPSGRAHRRGRRPRRSGRSCPRAPSSRTSPTPRGSSSAAATAGCPPARLALSHRRRDRPGPAGRRRARRSRAPTAG